MNPEEGEEFFIDDPERWGTLAVARGDVLEVHLPATNLDVEADIWAGFWVKQVTITAEGAYTVVLKSLGCSDPDWSKYLSGMFNRREGRAHFCDTVPCGAIGDFAMHIRRVKVFSIAGFHRSYMTSYTKRQVQKWDQEGHTDAGEEHLDLSGAAPRREQKEAEQDLLPGEEEDLLGSRPPALRPQKRPNAGRGVSEEERKMLRERLEDARGRMLERQQLAGDGKPVGARPPTPPPCEVSSEGASPSSPLDEEDVAMRELEDQAPQREAQKRLPPKAKKKKRKKKTEAERTPPCGSTSRMKALEDSKDGTTRDLQSQLLQQAAQTALRKKAKEKAEKRKSNKKSPGWQLAQILTKVIQSPGSQGHSGASGSNPLGDAAKISKEKKKKKDKKDRKHKRKQGRSGMDPSSSPDSSGEDSSGSGSAEGWDERMEEDSSSSNEKKLVAPLRRKSRKRPGSVLQMLIEHARSQLDQSAKVGIEAEENITVTSGVKLSSYFAIVVRPQLGQAMAQTRDLHHLSQCIDLLRQGDLDVLGDVLAGRFMSLHQSVLDGSWTTARHLELLPLEEGSAAGPAVVLQAQRHARLAEKVSPGAWHWQPSGKAKGGRGRGANWADNHQEIKGKGKKGPKGRGKFKGWTHPGDKDTENKGKERIPEK